MAIVVDEIKRLRDAVGVDSQELEARDMAASPGATRSRARIRRGAVALGLAGLLFALFPLIRPFGDDPSGGSEAVALTLASDAWVGSHLMLAFAFVLLNFGALTLYAHIRTTDMERLAFAAVIVTLIGATLLVGAASLEGVALNAFGKLQLRGEADVLAGMSAVRGGPAGVLFLGGLLALAVGGVLFAIAIWRSAPLPRWAGVALGIGLVLFMPFLPRPIRVVDGILIGIGAIGLAWCLWTSEAERSEMTSASAARLSG
jgi:hypothetical protein